LSGVSIQPIIACQCCHIKLSGLQPLQIARYGYYSRRMSYVQQGWACCVTVQQVLWLLYDIVNAVLVGMPKRVQLSFGGLAGLHRQLSKELLPWLRMRHAMQLQGNQLLSCPDPCFLSSIGPSTFTFAHYQPYVSAVQGPRHCSQVRALCSYEPICFGLVQEACLTMRTCFAGPPTPFKAGLKIRHSPLCRSPSRWLFWTPQTPQSPSPLT